MYPVPLHISIKFAEENSRYNPGKVTNGKENLELVTCSMLYRNIIIRDKKKIVKVYQIQQIFYVCFYFLRAEVV